MKKSFGILVLLGLILGGCCGKSTLPATPGDTAATTTAAAAEKADDAIGGAENAFAAWDWASIAKLDPAKAATDSKGELLWYDARELRIEGKGWNDTENFFERFPARAKPSLTPAVRGLCTNSAGMCIRFVSDAKKFKAAWKTSAFTMGHMPATGIRGLDLYARRDGKWKFVGSATPREALTTATIGVFTPELSGEPTEFMLYAPLYDRLLDLKIGLPKSASIAAAPARPAALAKPVIFYGTSITQGGCASRTGMCHPAILGRRLNREVINLGFSGSGQMEMEIANLLAELDPCIYVLECLPNMSPEMVETRLEPFVGILRKARPTTPILLVANPVVSHDNKSNKDLREIFDRLKAAGDANLYFLPAEGQLKGAPGEENGTVDGVHPTDLGFQRMANVYYPVLKTILESSAAKQ